MALGRRHRIILFVSLVIIFIFLRATHLSHVFWLDESFSAMLATQPVSAIPELCARDVHPPLYFILLRWWNRLGLLFSGTNSPEKEVTVLHYELEKFTHSFKFIVKRSASGEVFNSGGIWEPHWSGYNLSPIWFLRLLSLLAGVASLVLLYKIGLLLFAEDRTAVTVGCLFFAVSRFSVFWDTAMRSYSLSTALLLLIALLLITEGEKPKLSRYVLLAVVLLVSFFTSYITFVFLPAHFCLLLLLKKGKRSLGMFLGAVLVSVGVLLLFWGWAIARQASLTYSNVIELRHFVSWLARNVFSGVGFCWHLMTSYEPWQNLTAHDTVLFFPLFMLFSVLLAAGIWFTARRKNLSDIILLVFIFLPIMIPAMVNSFVPGKLPFQPRHFYPATPFLSLFLARALTQILSVKLKVQGNGKC